MQIVAHSVVPPNPLPYLHLGYLSATTASTVRQPFFTLGLPLVLTGVLLSLLLFKHACRFAVIFGTLLFIAGAAIMYHNYIPGGQPVYGRKLTGDILIGYASTIINWQRAGKPVPSNALRQIARERNGKPEDAWSRPLRLREEMIEGKATYRIISAGNDGIFGTEDDITQSTHDIDLEIAAATDTTLRRMRLLLERLSTRQREGIAIPLTTDLMQVGKACQLSGSQLEDGWGWSLHLTKVEKNQRVIYTVTSAGYDRKLDTSDDITLSTEDLAGSSKP